MWVKIRSSEAERAEWHAKARAAGLTLSDLMRRSLGRVRPWSVAHADVERERTQQLARLGNNLNQIARWANTHKGAVEAVEVIAHLAMGCEPVCICCTGESQTVWIPLIPTHICICWGGGLSARSCLSLSHDRVRGDQLAIDPTG